MSTTPCASSTALLTLERDVGAVEQKDDSEPPAEKMARLAALWRKQQEAVKLDAVIEGNLREPGYGKH